MKRFSITGSSGRIGRGIHRLLAANHRVKGIDRSPSSATNIVADLADEDALRAAFEDCAAVFHTAALHSPHVGIFPDKEFEQINVEGTDSVLRIALELGVPHVVITSTTALYGYASQDEATATWITEETVPQPRTIYHRTKLMAEALAKECSNKSLRVSIIRMSRCFPEPAPLMAAYRLHRGVDVRDVATAHLAAVNNGGSTFSVFNVSGKHPFEQKDCEALKFDAEGVLREKCPELVTSFERRGWSLPSSIDRVYDASKARDELGWETKYGFEEVLAQLDRYSSEVLPAQAPGSEVKE